MQICPVCDNLLTTNPCPSCGYDVSVDFERLPTLAPIGDTPAVSARRRAWLASLPADVILCPDCGCRAFSAAREPLRLVCLRCGGTVPISGGDVPVIRRGRAVAVGSNRYGQCALEGWTDIIDIACGEYHTVGLRADGTALAAGYSDAGQCGVGDWTDIAAVSAGYGFTVGLKRDGTIVTVGEDIFGKKTADGWGDIASVSAGSYHVVGLRRDGTVVAAGNNDFGQCRVSGWRNVVAVSAGSYHTIGLHRDGTVLAAGRHEDARCDVQSWRDIAAVAAGSWWTAGLRRDGTVVVTGGYLKQDWTDIVSIAAQHQLIGVKRDGTAAAVGMNDNGECDVESWRNVIAVAAGNDHTAAIVEAE